MTPKEKAQELRDKFYFETTISELEEAKDCALIAVNEIILANPHTNPLNTNKYSTMDYWQEVKKELIEL